MISAAITPKPFMNSTGRTDDLSWGYRFGELANALIDCGCRMQLVRYSSLRKPCIIKFVVRPGIRFVLDYDVDDCPYPGRVHVKRIAVVIPIGRLMFDDDLHRPVTETAEQIYRWALTGKSDISHV